MNASSPASVSPPSDSASLSCVVVEDQRMFLHLLVGMLQLQHGLRVVATATTAAQGIEVCLRHRPDLLILDLSLPDQDGQVVAEALANLNPDARLIVLSAQASSFVCPPQLQPILHAVVDKIDAYDTLGAEIAELLEPQPDPRFKLTGREHEVLQLIGEGLSNSQISEVLQLSVHTVETHRRNLSCKLGFKGAELVRYATLQNLKTL
jgi:DNA-binding NarL/FixJ family response regulator